MTTQSTTVCPFCDILAGIEPGTIIARNDEKRFALIKSIHPESVIHWLAIPFEHMESTEAYEGEYSGRFIELFEWAVIQTKQLISANRNWSADLPSKLTSAPMKQCRIRRFTFWRWSSPRLFALLAAPHTDAQVMPSWKFGASRKVGNKLHRLGLASPDFWRRFTLDVSWRYAESHQPSHQLHDRIFPVLFLSAGASRHVLSKGNRRCARTRFLYHLLRRPLRRCAAISTSRSGRPS
jgi:hypothetical protein